MQYSGPTYIKKIFVVYLNFKFNQESCISSGNFNYFKNLNFIVLPLANNRQTLDLEWNVLEGLKMQV